jgi:hypothetical protein
VFTKIQTYLIVTVFTVLIWLYAEGENVRWHELEVYPQFVAPAGRDLVIEVNEPPRVTARFRCATSQLAQVQAAFAQGVRLEMHTDEKDGDPIQDVELASRLTALQAISDLGIVIEETRPATVQVRVESLVSRRVPIAGVVEGDVQLASPAVVDVAEATVRLPASVARLIDDATRIEARINATNLESLDVNVQHTLEVPLNLPEALRGPYTVLSPVRANVTFRIRDLREKFVIPIVPVLLAGPPVDLGKYRVALDEDNRVLREVAIVGPSDAIDRIRKRDFTVYALLMLNSDELERAATGAQSKQVIIQVPAGVTVDTTPDAVNFTVTRAEPSPLVAPPSTGNGPATPAGTVVSP